jgi:tetratricopeptide (TPR) repeat protein
MLLTALALLLCAAGCPPAATGGRTEVAALSEASLPSEPDKLLQIADEQHEKGAAQNEVLALEHALSKNPEWAASKAAYEAYYRLARAYSVLSDTEDAAKKAQMSERGAQAGRKATELEPDKVEGHYFLAQNLGWQAQAGANKGENKALVAEVVQHAERALQIDEKYDHGGPARLLGALYAKAPAPPLSIGDPEKAVKLLQQAVSLDAAYPANTIYLADALVADERFAEAETAVKSARALLEDKRWAREQAPWRAELGRVERKLRAKQG